MGEHTGSSAAIAVHNLRKVYGNKAAVDGLDLEVPRGCFFGFLGPNGAGKTTTIRMLMGLAPPTSGSIQLLGLPMPEHSLEVKGKIGLRSGRLLALISPTTPDDPATITKLKAAAKDILNLNL